MFLGTYQHVLDAKSRLALPAKFRDGLGSCFYITRSMESKCLLVFTEEEWHRLNEQAKLVLTSDTVSRRFKRMFFGGAADVEPDSQGRVLISEELRSYAELLKDVVSVGVTDHIEIWSKENWDSYYNSVTDEEMDQMSEKMAQLGI
ncbi:MAG: division/cell wall cluster transcriptional repressor MraZ [Clostridiales bacterium]|nr:division/cell wall cluster transcriptional repressor MraZ [Clostridiales bacterium]